MKLLGSDQFLAIIWLELVRTGVVKMLILKGVVLLLYIFILSYGLRILKVIRENIFNYKYFSLGRFKPFFKLICD